MEKEDADLVFSSNYFPLVSRVCQKFNKPYAALVYDCPHLSLYSATVINKCNYIFTFDRATCDDLINKCRYYLEHENERMEIAANGHEKIKAHHTYEMRLNEILNMIFN